MVFSPGGRSWWRMAFLVVEAADSWRPGDVPKVRDTESQAWGMKSTSLVLAPPLP
jgi:hypothetical protein